MKTETLIDWREWKDGDAAFVKLNELLAPHGVKLIDVTPPHCDFYELEAESGEHCTDCLIATCDQNGEEIRESSVIRWNIDLVEQWRFKHCPDCGKALDFEKIKSDWLARRQTHARPPQQTQEDNRFGD